MTKLQSNAAWTAVTGGSIRLRILQVLMLMWQVKSATVSYRGFDPFEDTASGLAHVCPVRNSRLQGVRSV